MRAGAASFKHSYLSVNVDVYSIMWRAKFVGVFELPQYRIPVAYLGD